MATTSWGNFGQEYRDQNFEDYLDRLMRLQAEGKLQDMPVRSMEVEAPTDTNPFLRAPAGTAMPSTMQDPNAQLPAQGILGTATPQQAGGQSGFIAQQNAQQQQMAQNPFLRSAPQDQAMPSVMQDQNAQRAISGILGTFAPQTYTSGAQQMQGGVTSPAPQRPNVSMIDAGQMQNQPQSQTPQSVFGGNLADQLGQIMKPVADRVAQKRGFVPQAQVPSIDQSRGASAGGLLQNQQQGAVSDAQMNQFANQQVNQNLQAQQAQKLREVTNELTSGGKGDEGFTIDESGKVIGEDSGQRLESGSRQALADIEERIVDAKAFAEKVAQSESKKPGFFQRALRDPIFWANAAIAFNTLRTNPDASLTAAMTQRIKDLSEYKRTAGTATQTIATLRQLGETDPNALVAAQLIEANPDSAKEIMKQYTQKRFEKQASPQSSGPQVDPDTGQIFTIVFEPSSGKTKRQNIEGAFAETDAQKLQREARQEQVNLDIKTAFETGVDVFEKAGGIDEQIALLDQALLAVEAGASTGVIRNMLPAFDSSTAQLRAVGNQLGINIINSATFGALSEKELGLALSTGLDLSLKGEELKKHIRDKINARKKLRKQLMEDAKQLTRQGAKFSEYVAKREAEAGVRTEEIINYAPPGMLELPPELQNVMSDEAINTFYLWPEQKQREFLRAGSQ
jgi:hypothetical protein